MRACRYAIDVLARARCLAQGQVGTRGQRVPVLAIDRIDADPGAGGDADGMALDVEGQRQCLITLRATVAAYSGRSLCHSTGMNSSPPGRATVSSSRTVSSQANANHLQLRQPGQLAMQRHRFQHLVVTLDAPVQQPHFQQVVHPRQHLGPIIRRADEVLRARLQRPLPGGRAAR